MPREGDTVHTASHTYTLGQLIGDGGQAEVFLLSDQSKAGKIYRFLDGDQMMLQHARLQRMISSGPPAPAFVWPEEIIERPSLGYTMELVSGLMPIARIGYSEYLQRVDLRTRLRISYRLVDAFSKLHLLHGYAYCDLSDQNILCDISAGAVRIIDSDNLSIEGSLPPIVGGTYRLMAPEIQSRAVRHPNVETDLHSLAVLIFELLVFHHPLIGDEVHDDAELEDQALGDQALYIYHPTDRRNRYTKYQVYGGVPITLLPRTMQDLLHECFVVGLHQPNLRVRETRWKQELIHQLDTLVRCQNSQCMGKQTFLTQPPQTNVKCVWCGSDMRDIRVMKFVRPRDGRAVRYKVVSAGAPLAAHHCKIGREFDFDPSGECGRIEEGEEGLTVRNVSKEMFSYYRPGSSTPSSFPPNRRVRLRPGYRIVFGANGYQAEIVT